MGFLKGKRALIFGLASNRSIAYGIARAMHEQGAELAFSYLGEKLRPRVEKMAAGFDSQLTMPCDVSSDDQIEAAFAYLGEHWDGLDIIVHAVAFADSEELRGDYVDNVSRAGFGLAQDISAYSFVAMAKHGRAMMQGRNGAMLTLSYLGAVRALPNYNVMGPAKASLEANVRYMAYSLGPEGTRVNAVSAGPIRTLAASGIGNFRRMLDATARVSPLRRNVSIQEVGSACAFLCSDLASGITGEILYVDCGFNTVAVTGAEE